MAQIPSWFDSSAYFKNKLAAMKGYNELTLRSAFKNAGYNADSAESMYDHFVAYGKDEGVSPNGLFNADEYLYAKAARDAGTTNVSEQMVKSMWLAIAEAGMTPWDHYVKYGAWENGANGEPLSPSNGFDAGKYMAAKLEQMQKDDAGYTMEKLVEAFQASDLTPLTHYLAYGKDEGLSYDPIGNGAAGKTINLTKGDDSLYGSSGDDFFNAGAGFLGDNDYVDGLGGYDTMKAVLTSSNTPAVQPTITNVEKIVLQAQKVAAESGSNLTWRAALDAGEIKGLEYLQNDNSRAKLVVEDIRTDSNKMTIEWSNADPAKGNGAYGDGMDFEVYFNPQNLKADGAESSGTLYLKVMDVQGGKEANQPLRDNPYDKFVFQYTADGGAAQKYTLEFRAADMELYTGDKASYDTLVQAFKNAITDLEASTPALKGVLSVEKGAQFTATADTGSKSWTYDKGSLVNLTAQKGIIEANNLIKGTGWLASGPVPPSSGLITDVGENPMTECPLIKTNVVLDNVGRVQWGDLAPDCQPDDQWYGSESGDLIIGSMANRGGVERFDVKVDRGSWISSLQSTNNALRMVTVVNEGDGNTLAQANEKGPGQLFIGQQFDDAQDSFWDDLFSWTDKATLLSTNGLKDVKEFDASAFEGNLNIGARLTSDSYYKYMKSVDGKLKIDGKFAPNGDFHYQLGKAADVLNMSVDSGLAADRDFKFVVDAGAGDDLINFAFSGPISANQLVNSDKLRNVVLNGGAGDDDIKVWGDTAVTANGGAGDDFIQVSQDAVQGDHAVFIFNTAAVEDREIYMSSAFGAQSMNNDILSTAATAKFDGFALNETLSVTVSFKGIASKSIDIYTHNSSTVKSANISTDDINRAIIEAINDDPILGKVLVAKDGAGYSLLVESLIDGVMIQNDLAITFKGNAKGSAISNFSHANYATEFARDNGFDADGTEWGTDGLNRVNGGAGDDTFVLNAGSDAAWFDTIVFSGSNVGHDTVFNFENGADKIDVTHYGKTNLVGNSFNTTVDGKLVAVDKITNKQILSFIDKTAYGVDDKGVQFVQYGDSDTYIAVNVQNDKTAALTESEVSILGTITFANTLNGDPTAFNSGDLVGNAAPVLVP